MKWYLVGHEVSRDMYLEFLREKNQEFWRENYFHNIWHSLEIDGTFLELFSEAMKIYDWEVTELSIEYAELKRQDECIKMNRDGFVMLNNVDYLTENELDVINKWMKRI